MKISLIVFILTFTNSSFALNCKERIHAVYQDGSLKNSALSLKEKGFVSRLSFEDSNVQQKIRARILAKVKHYYASKLYEMTPIFENAKIYYSASALPQKMITGYIVRIGVSSDEGSAVFTVDAQGRILFVKTIDQSPEYKMICEK